MHKLASLPYSISYQQWSSQSDHRFKSFYLYRDLWSLIKASLLKKPPFLKGIKHWIIILSVKFCSFTFLHIVGTEVLTAVVTNSSIFSDIMLCSPLKVNQHYRGTCRLHLLILRPEDGGGMFLWNVDWLSIVYMALYPRRQNSLLHINFAL
jgi:hypothetical protein